MKVFIRTYGCRANQYDSEAVRQLVASAGGEEVATASEADVAIFNSCTVTAAAEADLRADVRAAARARPGLRSMIIGCAPGVPSRNEADAPLATLPSVEATVAGADLGRIALALGAPAKVRPGLEGSGGQTGARALLRIQDGCDEHCTFCATTVARGANRSRDAQTLVDEARQLARHHPEIVLTGIHIGSYGRDTGSSLGQLLDQLVSDVPQVRFRLTSIEATEVDSRLAALLRDATGRVAPHLHAPLQSGSDAVLRRMGRHWYTAASYERAVLAITEDRPIFALSADVITGFPGERESDHEATLAIVDRLPFTALHVFPYSPRPGTAALRLPDAVPSATAKRRARELRVLAAAKARAYAEFRSGGSCDVVVTGRGEGLTEDYLSVSLRDQSLPRRSRVRASLRHHDGRLTAEIA